MIIRNTGSHVLTTTDILTDRHLQIHAIVFEYIFDFIRVIDEIVPAVHSISGAKL